MRLLRGDPHCHGNPLLVALNALNDYNKYAAKSTMVICINGALFRKRQIGWKDQRGRSMPESRARQLILFINWFLVNEISV